MPLARIIGRLAAVVLGLCLGSSAVAATLALVGTQPVSIPAGQTTIGVQVRVGDLAANPSAVLAIALPGRCSQLLSQPGGVTQTYGTTIPAGTTVFRLLDNYAVFGGCGDGVELARLEVLAHAVQSVPLPPAYVRHSASEPDPANVKARWAVSVGATHYGLEWKRQDCPNWIGGEAMLPDFTPGNSNEHWSTRYELTHGMWAARVRARNAWGWSAYRAADSAPLYTAVGSGNPSGVPCPGGGGVGGDPPGVASLTATPGTVSNAQGQTSGSIALRGTPGSATARCSRSPRRAVQR